MSYDNINDMSESYLRNDGVSDMFSPRRTQDQRTRAAPQIPLPSSFETANNHPQTSTKMSNIFKVLVSILLLAVAILTTIVIVLGIKQSNLKNKCKESIIVLEGDDNKKLSNNFITSSDVHKSTLEMATESFSLPPMTTRLRSNKNDKRNFAFHVSMAEESKTGLSMVPFEIVKLDEGNAFNVTAKRYIVPSDGIYFIFLSAIIRGNVTAVVRLMGTSSTPDILRNSVVDCDYTIALREDMQLLTKSSSLWIASDHPVYSNNNTLQTTFGAFQLNHVMKNFTAFAVRLKMSHDQLGKIPFNEVYFESSYELWNRKYHIFKAPKSGLYYFSLTVATVPDKSLLVSVRAYGNTVFRIVYECNDNTCGTETLSRSYLLRINKGDEIAVYLETGALFSDIRYQMSFMGFLYEPETEGSMKAIAWSLSLLEKDFGHRRPLHFVSKPPDSEGGGWNPTTHTYQITSSGYYFIHISAIKTYNITLEMQLVLNDHVVATIYEGARIGKNGKVTRARDVILYLNLNDVLHINLSDDYKLFDINDEKLFTFIGFRIF